MTVAFSFQNLHAHEVRIGGRLIKKGTWNDRQIEYVDGLVAIKLKPGVVTMQKWERQVPSSGRP